MIGMLLEGGCTHGVLLLLLVAFFMAAQGPLLAYGLLLFLNKQKRKINLTQHSIQLHATSDVGSSNT